MGPRIATNYLLSFSITVNAIEGFTPDVATMERAQG